MDYTKIEQYHLLVQPHLRAVAEIRKKLIGIIRAAVENHGYIGTFYKNLGEHHTKDQTEEEYDDSPIVAIQNGAYNCYGGFEGNTVYDLFIDPEDGRLLVTLNGEAGEDFDEPIEHVQVEGLLCIVSWLAENGFVEHDEETPEYYCEECGRTNVERKAWVKPNEGNKFVDYSSDDSEDGDNWCHNCDDHVDLVDHETFVNNIEDWWNSLGPYEKESASGLWMMDYDIVKDNWVKFSEACQEWWKNLSIEQKITIWKQYNSQEQ